MQLASSRSSGELRVIKKSSSCSTLYIDDSTVSQPNLKNTIKVVSLAIYYNIKNRTSNQVLDIFDEKLHPLTVRTPYADLIYIPTYQCWVRAEARLSFGSSFWEKSSARLAISCKKSSVQLGLLYDLKKQVTLKKNELISNFFANFYRYNPEDINKSVFFPLKSCIL